MTFLAPLMLLGLFAVAIPPILHLLNRKEAKPVDFPAIEFLRRAYRKTARRLKMKQWLLLTLRMLLFLALALALAKPMWVSESSLRPGAPNVLVTGAHVIILDQSYSMGYELTSDQKERLFDVARAQALRLIDESNGPLGIVVTGAKTESLTQTLTADHSLLKEGIRRLELTDDVSQFDEAFHSAYQLLRDQPLNAEKQITVLSTPHRSLSNVPPIPAPLGSVKVQRVRLDDQVMINEDHESVSSDEPQLSAKARAALANHAITDLKLSPAPQMGRDQWRVEVHIANFSDEEMKLWPIWVELEGEVLVKGFVSLKAQERAVKRLYFKVNQAKLMGSESLKENDVAKETRRRSTEPREKTTVAMRGWVKLSPDALSIDDRWPFWIESKTPTSVLALNGDPRPTPHEDELFYLERALAPTVLGDTPVTLRSKPILSAELTDQELEGVDLILLANLPRPSLRLGEQLREHLESGGGLWLAPGARSDVEVWNRSLGDLLPRPLRGMRRAGDAAAVEGRSVARLRDFTNHQLLSPLESPERSSLALAEVEKYFLFDPKAKSNAETVITLDEGSPFMMTQEVGEGRVVLWAGPVDREWSDLVIRPDFVPLAAETVRYLSREQGGLSLSLPLNHRLRLELNGEGPFYTLSPVGERKVMTRAEQESRSGKGSGGKARGWQSAVLKQLGHYQVISAREILKRDSSSSSTQETLEDIKRRFVVHLNTSESDLQDRILERESPDSQELSESREVGAIGQRRELWHLGLIGLFVFALLEGLTLFQRREVPVKS